MQLLGLLMGLYTSAVYRAGPAAAQPLADQAPAEGALGACAEEPDPVSEAVATMLRGWALAEAGAAAEGLATLRESLERFLASGQRLMLEGVFCFLADAPARAGDVAGALATLA